MQTYLRLIKYVSSHIWLLVVAVFFMIVSSMTQPVTLAAVIPFIDRILVGKPIILPDTNIPFFIKNLVNKINAMPPAELLTAIIIFVVSVFIIRAIAIYFQSYFMREVSQRVVRDVRNLLYDKLLSLSMDFYSRSQTGTLVSRITYDSTIIQDATSEGLTDLIWQSFTLVFSAVFVLSIAKIFSINPRFLLLVFVIIPLIVAPLILIGRRLRQISKRSQESMAGINNTLFESISGIRIIKGFCMEDYERRKFKSQNEAFKKSIMKSNKRILAVSPITEFVSMLIGVTILVFGFGHVLDGTMSAGALIAFLAAVLSFTKPINRLSRVHNVNQQALAAATRIFDLLDEDVTIKEKEGAVELAGIGERISFSGADFSYEKGNKVLHDISFDVKAGHVTAFVGPSGAGKTTVVNLLPRFYDADKGNVEIDGRDVKDFTIRSLRERIGIVTQETVLFNDTAKANITYGHPDAEMDRIISAAKAANAHDFIMKMPDQYNTIIGERGFKLSGGEKQRLAIARAIFKNPPILIFDEATSQLDSESEKLVQEAIDRLMEGRTVFVIAHRLSTIKHADNIIVMENGRIVDKGRHEELLDRAGLYKKLYTMQFAGI